MPPLSYFRTPLPWVSLLVFGICFLKYQSSFDLEGYRDFVLRAYATGFSVIPYPVGAAKWADYFQSPLATLFLVPFSLLPLWATKLSFAVLHLGLMILLWIRFRGPSLGVAAVCFLAFLFVHPVSGVFHSGNLSFLALASLIFGWDLIKKPTAPPAILGGALIAASIAFRVLPGIALVWMILTRSWRSLAYTLGASVALFLLTWVVLGNGCFAWWTQWWAAVKLYPQAASPLAPSYQSPVAVFFRFMARSGMTEQSAYAAAEVFSKVLVVLGLCFAYVYRNVRVRGEDFPFYVVVSLLFIANPYALTPTNLALFPLLMLLALQGVPRLTWFLSLALALLPKGLWPEPLWNRMAFYGFPAALIFAIYLLALRQLSKPQVNC